MWKYIVEDLHGMLASLGGERVEVDDRTEEYEYGKFDWLMDPEGNRMQLCEPPKFLQVASD